MIHQLIAHLYRRPFAPVFNQLHEREAKCKHGLKLMCIVDYETEERDLYNAIGRNELFGPNFLVNLMKFSSYCAFNYVEYFYDNNNFIDDDYLLACKYCGMVGPYLYILTHMAISHGVQIGLRKCNYCNEVPMETHLKKNTLKDGYEQYKNENAITDTDNWNQHVVNTMIKLFYNRLRSISIDMKAVVQRDKFFVGRDFEKNSKLEMLHGHSFDTNNHSSVKIIDFNELNRKFEEVIENMYKGNGLPNDYPQDVDASLIYNSSDCGGHHCGGFNDNLRLSRDEPAEIKMEVNECALVLTTRRQSIISCSSIDDRAAVKSRSSQRIAGHKRRVVPPKRGNGRAKGLLIVKMLSKLDEISRNIAKINPKD